ncbi:probable ATP-dependent DNA helicase HFM1 isoform X3 [Takifugu rubripes]|uniref:probable ATP-dependent DNA helicase HFM1 isoform X3 n=1 Tax=Takifugu rubripes TaxID=31033 RepID=UPI00114523FA|nr:probable ATP-dependent DNA helicase HFM1 isoform X3 [Takifugu rubripes]
MFPPKEMLDSEDSILPLDNLFFEKPIVHKVKPLQQETCQWMLEMPPSLSLIPATPEPESLSTLYNFFQKPKMLPPAFQEYDGLDVLPSKINSIYNNNMKEADFREAGKSTTRCEGLWVGEVFRNYSQGACQSGRKEDENPQDLSHTAISLDLSPDQSTIPAFRRSLFKVQVSNSEGDSSNADGHTGSCSHTASRPQTFRSQVTMVTVPPPPQLPQATVSLAVSPPSPRHHFSPLPPTGSSAASSRPLQQAALAKTQDKGTKRAFVPPMTPQPLRIKDRSDSGILRPVSEIPKFRSVFSEFPFFNYVQSKALDDVLYTGKNFVACAPTGSGKTVLFELAIIRLLMQNSEPWNEVKAVYMAPIKALCSQCFENWNKKFGPLGLTCKELTGDTEIDDFFEIQDSHIILTTPEKWDSMTRKWKDHCLLQQVRLFLIDEVHVIKDATRGATLEVVVSRMKAVNAYRAAQNQGTSGTMRIVAVSATIPNISDIADWLSHESLPATYLDMDESHRPVMLRKVVLGFPCPQNQTEFKFDLSLNYKMANIIQTYSDQKPALVFCSTRKGAQQAATVLAKDARFIMSIEHNQRLMKYANSILDSKLRELVMLGVGYHHAGVDLSDRKLIEMAFTQADLPVLFTTRTLAMGVNLPAHLVVIKSTMQYVAGSCEEYSDADMLQMIGRAGRPQFDTTATAVIMTKIQSKDKYMNLMNGVEIIESSLHSHLVEHLNAEIVLQTISDVNMALDWIRSTFLYIRALKNPSHYGFPPSLDRCGIEAKLQELCLRNLNSLSSIGLIDMDEDINIKPTETGKLMARYCIAFDTMNLFSKVAGTENLSDLIELLSRSKEFSNIQLRVNEKRALNTLNRDKNRLTIRFPFQGKIKTTEMKVNCLIQAQLGSLSIQEFGLSQDTARIFRTGTRISRCLSEFLSHGPKTGFSALLNSLILAKCFRAKLWENSPYVSKQLEKIGQTLSTAMVNAGLTTFSKIEQTNPRELELIVNRHPPFGNQIRDSVVHLPKYEVILEQLPRYSCAAAEMVVKVNLKNQAELLTKKTAPDYHYVSLIIGNSDNVVVFQQKLTSSMLLKSGSWSKKIEVAKASKGEEISVNLISSEYVGLDIQQKINVHYSGARSFRTQSPYYVSDDGSGLRPQMSDHQVKTQGTVSTAAADQGNTRKCNHFCRNKDLCGHDCCKVGVSVARKRAAHHFSSYLEDLRSRCDTLPETPVKRLKMKQSAPVNCGEFAYRPKERLPAASRYSKCYYKTSVTPHVEVDLTGEHDDDYDDLLEDVQTSVASHTRHPMGMNPGFSDGGSQTHQPDISQTGANGFPRSEMSTFVSNTHCGAVSSTPIPTVCFDLGNEWDDFEDENLLRASEESLTLCPANAKRQHSQEEKIPGVTTAAPVFLNHSRVKTCGTTTSRPLGLISPNLYKTIRNPEPSPAPVTPQSSLTLDWSRQRPRIFSEELIGKTPENFHGLTHTGCLTQKLDLFSAMSDPVNNRSACSKEEETFLGIFDGIF